MKEVKNCLRKMQSLSKKTALLLPKCPWKTTVIHRWATSSSLFKFSSVLGLKKDSGDQSKVSQQETPGRKKYFVPRKFIPMTRRALIRRIVEDDILLKANDRHYFQGLAEIVEKSIAGIFHVSLAELKVIFAC